MAWEWYEIGITASFLTVPVGALILSGYMLYKDTPFAKTTYEQDNDLRRFRKGILDYGKFIPQSTQNSSAPDAVFEAWMNSVQEKQIKIPFRDPANLEKILRVAS